MGKRSIIALICLIFIHYSGGDNEYILNTSKCKIPNLKPLNDDVKDLMKPKSYYSCNQTELLSFITRNEDNVELHIREDLISQKNISCCYSYVTRNGSVYLPDEGISISECQYFEKKVVLKDHIVKVSCHDETSETIYENVHNPIIIKDSVKTKLDKFKDGHKPFSVLFIVVDSISRLNFIRTMPQAYNYLINNDFIEMKGYTKVADNTFPNFMALLTGFNYNQGYKTCNPKIKGKLDKCPMIWYDYRQKGYITAYAEDDSSITTYNFNKVGFTDPPTDYYFKPYIEATETMRIVGRYTMPYCTGPESAGERILSLAKDFATTFQNHSTFGIFWMNTFSHNDINAPHGMDEKMKNFFSDIKNTRVLENSFVVFLSDHGIRYGDVRATRSGWLEERMPMNFIYVPKTFKEKYAQKYHNLKENSNKLTNTYDMFMTLQHILTLSGVSHNIRPSLACPKCKSLFQKVPLERSCKDASIDEEWCTCLGHFKAIDPSDNIVKNATIKAFKQVKRFLDYKNTNCTNDIEPEIISASISESISEAPHTKYLFIVFQVKPTYTAVLATIKFKRSINNKSLIFLRYYYVDLCMSEDEEGE